jgi:hypothetical protein
MALQNNLLFLVLASLVLASCGVKGKPMPPLEPPSIGTGEPTYLNKKDEKKNNQKR